MNISVANCDLNGNRLADILRDRYNFECESSQLRHVILMATVGDDFEIYKKLSSALSEIDCSTTLCAKPALPCPEISGKIYNFDTCGSESVKTEVEKSCGRISAEFIYAYPPGIPIIFPNELITEDTINRIGLLCDNGVNITSTGKLLPRFILTKQAQ